MKKIIVFVLFIACIVLAARCSQEDDDFWNTVKVIEAENTKSSQADEEPIIIEKEEQQSTETTSDEKDASQEEKKTDKLNTPPPQFFTLPEQENYYMEISAGIILVTYIVLYFVGKKQNENIAFEWANQFNSLISSNFSSVARTNKLELWKESPSEFKLVATGRVNVAGMHVTMTLLARQDLITRIYQTFFRYEDRIIVDIPLLKMDSFVFALTPSKFAKAYVETNPDLAYMAKIYEFDDIPGYSVITDSPELFRGAKTALLSKAMLKTFKDNTALIETLHISDTTNFFPERKQVIRIAYKLPDNGDYTKLQPIMELALALADYIATSPQLLTEDRRSGNKRLRVAYNMKLQQEREKQAAEQQKEETKEVEAKKDKSKEKKEKKSSSSSAKKVKVLGY